METIETSIINNSNLKRESSDENSVDDPSDLESSKGENYWRTLAERRGMALEEALAKNAILNQRIMFFEEETALTREMLNEARSLIEVLNDVIEGKIEMDNEEKKKGKVVNEEEEKNKLEVTAPNSSSDATSDAVAVTGATTTATIE